MEVSGLRKRKQLIKAVRELDAFPKVPEGYKESSVSGGGVSLLVLVISVILIVSEIRYYTSTELKYDYEVDTTVDGKLSLNIDMTVAMKCKDIGADVLDLSGQNVASFGTLSEEDVHFDLSPKQESHLLAVRSINTYIRDEYHAIHKILWSSGYGGFKSPMPAREDTPPGPPNGCRLYGTLKINKVAGNFHITAGRSVPMIPRGHAHLSYMIDPSEYNFSHRIEEFSFGDEVPGKVNPLDGEEKITDANYHMYQYFMQVVPTHVQTMFSNIDTYQFAVTEQNRTIAHDKGSHGVPGIFVKYDLSPMKVKVVEHHKPFSQFLIRLCGIIGGLFATSGMLHSLAGFLVDLVCCRYHLGRYQESSPSAPASSRTQHTTSSTKIPSSQSNTASLLDGLSNDSCSQSLPSDSISLNSSPNSS